MMPFVEYIKKEFNVEFPETETVNAEWFIENDLPMVVRCCCCDMTMASPSSFVDEHGDIYCRSCAI